MPIEQWVRGPYTFSSFHVQLNPHWLWTLVMSLWHCANTPIELWRGPFRSSCKSYISNKVMLSWMKIKSISSFSCIYICKKKSAKNIFGPFCRNHRAITFCHFQTSPNASQQTAGNLFLQSQWLLWCPQLVLGRNPLGPLLDIWHSMTNSQRRFLTDFHKFCKGG